MAAAFAQANLDLDADPCGGVPSCMQAVSAANAKAHAGITLLLQSIVFGLDSFVVTLGEGSLDPLITSPAGGAGAMAHRTAVNLGLTIQVVRESGTALLLGIRPVSLTAGSCRLNLEKAPWDLLPLVARRVQR